MYIDIRVDLGYHDFGVDEEEVTRALVRLVSGLGDFFHEIPVFDTHTVVRTEHGNYELVATFQPIRVL